MGDGLQKLGADASKIEPKVTVDPSTLCAASPPPRRRAESLSPAHAQVWLASERTLLSWFRVALLLSSFALALFNSASDRDWASKTMGVIYAVIACAMLGYAWTMHRIRRYRIVMRYGGHHGASLSRSARPALWFGTDPFENLPPPRRWKTTRRAVRTARRMRSHLCRRPAQLYPPHQEPVRPCRLLLLIPPSRLPERGWTALVLCAPPPVVVVVIATTLRCLVHRERERDPD